MPQLSRAMSDLLGVRSRDVRMFGGPFSTRHYPPDLALEPRDIKISASVDIDAAMLSAEVTTTVFANQNGASSITLDAVDFFDVSVMAHERHTFAYDGSRLTITWSDGFKKGEERQFTIAYSIKEPVAGLYFMRPDSANPDKAYYAATDHETEKARHWLPCIDLPNVRTTVAFSLTAREDLTVLANGFLVGEDSNGDGTKTARWQLDQRCPSYLICFAIGDFVRCNDGDFDGKPLAYFACKDYTEEDLRRSFGRTRDMLTWMTEKLDCPFPYPKYYQFALPAYSGAMENISLVSWNDAYVLDEEDAPGWSWLVDQINVHEMGHSYFGDLIVCRDFAHAWLKESWATYIETCWLEDKRGEDEQNYDLFRNAQAYFKEADQEYQRPIVTREFTSSWQMYDRHLYPGGACRLHTLRMDVGDSAFWSAVRDYVKRYSEKVVETDDFRKVVEQHCGRSLGRFFDQWFLTPAFPDIKVSFDYDAERKLGTFVVEQKQVDEKAKIPPFVAKTEVGWVISGKLFTQELLIANAKQEVSVPMDRDPEQVRFDPKWRFLHRLEFHPGDGKLRTQMREAKDVTGRILAVFELAKSGRKHNLESIFSAWEKEPFWGVRREMAQALADAKTLDACRLLIRIIAFETDDRVLDKVFEVAAGFRDSGIREALMTRLEKGGLSKAATYFLLRALGSQREHAPQALLKSFAEKRTTKESVVAAGGLVGLGESRQWTAVQYLLDKTQPGALHYKARPSAVAGLGASVNYLERYQKSQAVEVLVDLLRDSEPWIRLRAAQSLEDAQAVDSLPQLTAFSQNLAHQDRIEIENIMCSLRADEDPKVKALEKQLDELRDKYHSLLDRVGKLEGRRPG